MVKMTGLWPGRPRAHPPGGGDSQPGIQAKIDYKREKRNSQNHFSRQRRQVTFVGFADPPGRRESGPKTSHSVTHPAVDGPTALMQAQCVKVCTSNQRTSRIASIQKQDENLQININFRKLFLASTVQAIDSLR